MSFDLLKSAKHVKGLSNAEFRVLFYLLESANNRTYECNPRIREIANTCDMGVRTVQRHISALAERGLFERVEQRRKDGSRSTNLYRFKVTGTIKIGRQDIVSLEPLDDDQEAEHDPNTQGAENGVLQDDKVPFPTGGGATVGGTNINREYNQESPPHASHEVPRAQESLFERLQAAARDPDLSPSHFVSFEWKALTDRQPGIAKLRKLDDGLAKMIDDRARQHRVEGESLIDVWKEALAAVERSTFLCGRAPPGRDRTSAFRLTLGWMVKAANFREILGGKYDDQRGNGPAAEGAIDGRRSPTHAAVAGALKGLRARGAGSFGRGHPAGDQRLIGG